MVNVAQGHQLAQIFNHFAFPPSLRCDFVQLDEPYEPNHPYDATCLGSYSSGLAYLGADAPGSRQGSETQQRRQPKNVRNHGHYC